jgi:hypothetical protein
MRHSGYAARMSATLRHDDEHALAQLRASIVFAREWSRFLLGDAAIPEPDRVRAV